MFNKFWKWYESHTTLNTGISAGLFTIQLIHLYWLTTVVVFLKLFGRSFFNPSPTFETVMTFVDYTEIPAIIATSVLYINEMRIRFNFKSLLFLVFLNSQWLHMFWITDEFVIQKFSGGTAGIDLPTWFAWTAIMIDYLELPVIYDTLKKFFTPLKAEGVKVALEELRKN